MKKPKKYAIGGQYSPDQGMLESENLFAGGNPAAAGLSMMTGFLPGNQGMNDFAFTKMGSQFGSMAGPIGTVAGAGIGLAGDYFTEQAQQRKRDKLNFDTNRALTDAMPNPYLQEGGYKQSDPRSQFAEGGPINPPATRSDSLALYDNSKKVLKYYKESDNGNYELKNSSKGPGTATHDQNDKRLKAFLGQEEFDDVAGGQLRTRPASRSTYREDISGSMYKQREGAASKMDTGAPMQLFHRSVDPTLMNVYVNPGTGDNVNLFGYDPISVKPWSMMSPAEQTARVKQYGNAGTPKDQSLGLTRVFQKRLVVQRGDGDAKMMETRTTREPAQKSPAPASGSIQPTAQSTKAATPGFMDSRVASSSTVRDPRNRQVSSAARNMVDMNNLPGLANGGQSSGHVIPAENVGMAIQDAVRAGRTDVIRPAAQSETVGGVVPGAGDPKADDKIMNPGGGDPIRISSGEMYVNDDVFSQMAAARGFDPVTYGQMMYPNGITDPVTGMKCGGMTPGKTKKSYADGGPTGSAGDPVRDFATRYKPVADQIAKELGGGVDPNWVLAQFGNETGWGKSVIPGTNNLGNIKAGKSWRGETKTAFDKVEGSNDPYRVYGSDQAFATDYASLLKRLYPGTAEAKTAKDYYSALQSGMGGRKYASSPNYVDNVSRAYDTLLSRTGQNLGTSEVPDEVSAPEPANPFPTINFSGQTPTFAGDNQIVPPSTEGSMSGEPGADPEVETEQLQVQPVQQATMANEQHPVAIASLKNGGQIPSFASGGPTQQAPVVGAQPRKYPWMPGWLQEAAYGPQSFMDDQGRQVAGPFELPEFTTMGDPQRAIDQGNASSQFLWPAGTPIKGAPAAPSVPALADINFGPSDNDDMIQDPPPLNSGPTDRMQGLSPNDIASNLRGQSVRPKMASAPVETLDNEPRYDFADLRSQNDSLMWSQLPFHIGAAMYNIGTSRRSSPAPEMVRSQGVDLKTDAYASELDRQRQDTNANIRYNTRGKSGVGRSLVAAEIDGSARRRNAGEVQRIENEETLMNNRIQNSDIARNTGAVNEWKRYESAANDRDRAMRGQAVGQNISSALGAYGTRAQNNIVLGMGENRQDWNRWARDQVRKDPSQAMALFQQYMNM
jgi:hypothetical protein